MKRKRRRPVTAPSYPSLLTVYIGNFKTKQNAGVVVGRASPSRCLSLLRRAGFRLWLHFFFWNHVWSPPSGFVLREGEGGALLGHNRSYCTLDW